MNIAIIGGGAAGIVTTWLLDERHDVTLFERDTVLGGNIRTLGGNVPCAALPSGLKLDAGVTEFDRLHFPKLHTMMRTLGVTMADVPITSALFLGDGSSWLAPERLRREFPSAVRRIVEERRYIPLVLSRKKFFARTADVSAERLRETMLDDYLDDDVFASWCKMLLMYGYSTPYELTGRISASLAIPTLRRFVLSSDWSRVVGGVWTYVERILDRLRGRVLTDADIEAVSRTDNGVAVAVAGAGTTTFDAVVFAVTPDRVLPLLADATDDERGRFAAWRSHTSRTIVHRDTGIYERRGIRYFSEFDLFATASGAHGYNAYLNRLCGIGDDADIHYSLAFGLDDEIDPACVLHAQTHVSPSYDVAALSRRDEVIATNGENRVWYAGAWLGDGLHEGAVASAEQVSIGLGGRLVDGAATPGADPGARNRR